MRDMKDPRSTGRRRARKELYDNYVPFMCVGYNKPDGSTVECGKTSIIPPKDAPSHFEEIWPTENRVLTNSLQADHETKDVESNDIQHLNWRCSSCHKFQDSLTAAGEATKKNNQLWADDGEGDSEPAIGIW